MRSATWEVSICASGISGARRFRSRPRRPRRSPGRGGGAGWFSSSTPACSRSFPIRPSPTPSPRGRPSWPRRRRSCRKTRGQGPGAGWLARSCPRSLRLPAARPTARSSAHRAPSPSAFPAARSRTSSIPRGRATAARSFPALRPPPGATRRKAPSPRQRRQNRWTWPSATAGSSPSLSPSSTSGSSRRARSASPRTAGATSFPGSGPRPGERNEFGSPVRAESGGRAGPFRAPCPFLRSRELVGALADPFEEYGREVALSGVGEHGQDRDSLALALRDLASSRERSAGGDAAEDPFLRREVAGRGDGLGVGHGHDLVETLAVEDLRDEVRRPALDLVRLPLLAREKRGALRLDDRDLDLFARPAQHVAGAGQRPARAVAGDPPVEPLADEVAQDL